eukprot:Gb_37583 [translate_table: standard]
MRMSTDTNDLEQAFQSTRHIKSSNLCCFGLAYKADSIRKRDFDISPPPDLRNGKVTKRSGRVAHRVAQEESPPLPLKLPKLHLVLTRKEIHEDWIKITGHKYTGKPRKSTLVQRGLGLCTALTCPSSIKYLNEPQYLSTVHLQKLSKILVYTGKMTHLHKLVGPSFVATGSGRNEHSVTSLTIACNSSRLKRCFVGESSTVGPSFICQGYNCYGVLYAFYSLAYNNLAEAVGDKHLENMATLWERIFGGSFGAQL